MSDIISVFKLKINGVRKFIIDTKKDSLPLFETI
jgi:hypothetical protein